MKQIRSLRAICSAAALSTCGATAGFADIAICATEQSIACPPYEECERSLPGAMNLPSLIKIDTGSSEVLSVQASGEGRSSAIGSISETEAARLIHGADENRPWVLHIDKASGRFTGTIAGDGVGFILFGECSWELMK